MTLSTSDINQILDEMNKKCVISADGNEQANAESKPKTEFEKIATNMAIFLTIAITMVSMPYLWPPFLSALMDGLSYTAYEEFAFISLWNLAITIFIICYLLMGIKIGGYLVAGMVFSVMFLELIYITNIYVLNTDAFNFIVFDRNFTDIITENPIKLVMAFCVLLIANLSGHYAPNKDASNSVFNIFMIIYLFICGFILVK